MVECYFPEQILLKVVKTVQRIHVLSVIDSAALMVDDLIRFNVT